MPEKQAACAMLTMKEAVSPGVSNSSRDAFWQFSGAQQLLEETRGPHALRFLRPQKKTLLEDTGFTANTEEAPRRRKRYFGATMGELVRVWQAKDCAWLSSVPSAEKPGHACHANRRAQRPDAPAEALPFGVCLSSCRAIGECRIPRPTALFTFTCSVAACR